MPIPVLGANDTPERGVLYWLTPEGVADWRRKVRARLENRDGHRVIYQTSHSTDKSLEPVDRDEGGMPVIEVPTPLEPRSARETTHLLAAVVVEELRKLSYNDPELYRQKLAEIRAMDPARANLTDEQLAHQIVDAVRTSIAAPSVRRITRPDRIILP